MNPKLDSAGWVGILSAHAVLNQRGRNGVPTLRNCRLHPAPTHPTQEQQGLVAYKS